MKKQPSSIILYKRGNAYFCDAHGCYGGGFTGAYAGDTAESAGLFALAQKLRYIDSSKLGGDMYLPDEVKKAVEASKL